MQSNYKTETTYTLILNEKEATWLRGVMKNPLHGEHPSTENTIDAKHRKAFLEAVQPPKESIITFLAGVNESAF